MPIPILIALKCPDQNVSIVQSISSQRVITALEKKLHRLRGDFRMNVYNFNLNKTTVAEMENEKCRPK